MSSSVDLAWGAAGARALAPVCDVLVLVDILSFTTSLTVAVGRGVEVWPYLWGTDGAEQLARDIGAEQLARDIGAVLARGRHAGVGPTLSPASLMELEPGTRLILPSPNGSSIAHSAARGGVPVVGACLRNARAAGELLQAYERVGLIASGERWTDGSLRPAYEDLIGAGVLAAALVRAGAAASPDAEAAAAAALRPRPLEECPSGLELVDRGFAEDVRIAGERDVTTVVPLLQSGRFSAAG